MRLSRVRNESKYLAIEYFSKEKDWSISWMCGILEISRASYYKWQHREQPEIEIENERIAALIVEYDERFGHILGYRRMTLWINRINDTKYSKNRIHRIMQAIGIHSVIRPKRYKYAKKSGTQISENVLKRDFFAERPNEKWSTDVTEFKVPGKSGKIYLSAIMDLYDRSIIAFQLSRVNNNNLVFKTFDAAIKDNPGARPIFHSDRGFQYTSPVFVTMLSNAQMTQSMSRVGHCIDNGPTEGFWGIVKTEMYCLYDIQDRQSLIDGITSYIHFYNYDRFQERFNGLAPMEVREIAMRSNSPESYPIPVNKRIEEYKARYSAT